MDMDEIELIIEYENQTYIKPKSEEYYMTCQNLIEYNLPFEYIWYEGLHKFFKNKCSSKLCDYIDSIYKLLWALETHNIELEQKLFKIAKIYDPYSFGSELGNFLYPILTFMISNCDDVIDKEDISIVSKNEESKQEINAIQDSSKDKLEYILSTFAYRCSNLKILLDLQEQISILESAFFEPISEALNERIKLLSTTGLSSKEMREVVNDESGLNNSKLSVESVLTQLFKLALNSYEKDDLDHLANTALDLFENIDRNKHKDIPSKTFRILDTKVGSKLTMAEAKAWSKVIKAIFNTGICSNMAEMNVLLKKSNRFLDKKSFKRDKQKMKKEIIRQHKYKIKGPREYDNKKPGTKESYRLKKKGFHMNKVRGER